MTRVTFISADGERRQEVDAPAGSVLLDVAQGAGQPLEGTCEGQMACQIVLDAGMDSLTVRIPDEFNNMQGM